LSKQVLFEKVDKALQTIRPFLEADGGNIELLEVTAEKTARVKLLGACQTCSMSSMTMKAGVEEAIKRAVPEINAVEAVNQES